MSKQNRRVIEEWLDRVWKQQDVSAIHEMYASGGPARGLGDQPIMGPDDFEQFHAAFCRLVDDIQVDIERSVESPKWVAALCTLRGRARATGEPIEMSGNIWARIETPEIKKRKKKKGKKKKKKSEKKRPPRPVITEAYNHWDFITLFEQLGLLPPETMTRGLSGQKTV